MTRILPQICTFLRYCTLPLLVILAACNDSASTERILTSDGQVIIVPKDEIYYPEEADFLTNLNPVVIQRKNLKAGQIMPVATDSVYGYDRTESIDWHKAKFGKWAEKYGYRSDVCYLVSTMALFKDVSCRWQSLHPSGQLFAFRFRLDWTQYKHLKARIHCRHEQPCRLHANVYSIEICGL